MFQPQLLLMYIKSDLKSSVYQCQLCHKSVCEMSTLLQLRQPTVSVITVNWKFQQQLSIKAAGHTTHTNHLLQSFKLLEVTPAQRTLWISTSEQRKKLLRRGQRWMLLRRSDKLIWVWWIPLKLYLMQYTGPGAKFGGGGIIGWVCFSGFGLIPVKGNVNAIV